MQVDSIISNTISQDIRLKGHQSIRFLPDGFSFLVTDASYRPVLLNHYTYGPEIPVTRFPGECGRILGEMNLLSFEGESVMIVNSPAVTPVPEQFYDESLRRDLLEKAAGLDENDQVLSRFIRGRKLYLIYAIQPEIIALKSRFLKEVKILHSLECLVSLSDQVQASDHQRGMVLADVQAQTLDLLVIIEDGIRLANRFTLKDTSDFIYHTLNTFRQLGLDLNIIPVYLSGVIHGDHELNGLLKKYIRHVRTTPYYLESLPREEVLRSMVLSEGIKCA
ncbi:MAG: DUF3822 family protein [Bacteroidetes bacterium]|nr:MAG: DUF3822 family protein [Bacteroidota bacterium]